MIIKKISPRTGIQNEMDLPITREQLGNWQNGGMTIQAAMPNLTPAQREFLMTGYTQEDWDAIFPKCPKCGETLEEPHACECGWDGWHLWQGGKNPVQGRAVVDYRRRDGAEHSTHAPHLLDWAHGGTVKNSDIVAYRVTPLE